MRQIIPFKKELLFKTKISEITSISLEHTLRLVEDNLVSGEFHISGDYKMTEASINREKFYFTLPFEIDLDNDYIVDDSKRMFVITKKDLKTGISWNRRIQKEKCLNKKIED